MFDAKLYHEQNPHIYDLFEKFAMQAIISGKKHLGAKMIVERIRWYTDVEAKNDQFKINNNMTPFYARLFEENRPQYKGFFRKRGFK